MKFNSEFRLKELKNNAKSNSQTLKVSGAAYGNVRSRECKNTEFVWGMKWGFVTAVRR